MDSVNQLVVNLEKSAKHNHAFLVRYFLDELFKVIKNINETSVNKEDRGQRLIELHDKYDIPITHLM